MRAAKGTPERRAEPSNGGTGWDAGIPVIWGPFDLSPPTHLGLWKGVVRVRSSLGERFLTRPSRGLRAEGITASFCTPPGGGKARNEDEEVNNHMSGSHARDFTYGKPQRSHHWKAIIRGEVTLSAKVASAQCSSGYDGAPSAVDHRIKCHRIERGIMMR